MENRICLVHWCFFLSLLESSQEFCGSSNRGHVTQYFHGWANLRLAMSFTVCICAGFTSVRLRYDLVVPDFTALSARSKRGEELCWNLVGNVTSRYFKDGSLKALEHWHVLLVTKSGWLHLIAISIFVELDCDGSLPKQSEKYHSSRGLSTIVYVKTRRPRPEISSTMLRGSL